MPATVQHSARPACRTFHTQPGLARLVAIGAGCRGAAGNGSSAEYFGETSDNFEGRPPTSHPNGFRAAHRRRDVVAAASDEARKQGLTAGRGEIGDRRYSEKLNASPMRQRRHFRSDEIDRAVAGRR